MRRSVTSILLALLKESRYKYFCRGNQGQLQARRTPKMHVGRHPADKVSPGQKFWRLTAIERVQSRPISGNVQWLFRCECGNETTAAMSDVKRGFKKSCGCLHKETAVQNGRSVTTHGMFGTSEYQAWADLIRRCNDETHQSYKYYGARGITVCERWYKFENFFADMGFRPAGLVLDRINNDGNYEPTNCRWTTVSQSNKNKRYPKKKK
jgi:hypothetical protein